jgi:nickel/cobalt transporter (NiCoT) family protein
VTAVAEVPPRAGRLASRLSRDEWRRLGGMFGFITVLHVVGFALLVLAATGHHGLHGKTTFGIGTWILAYTLGMRHAFDADHIAAIDNTTRKLMHEGKRPMGVGFFFSLGHSSVVFVLTCLLGIGIKSVGAGLQNQNSGLHQWGGLVGTSVSGGFLYLIAALNLIVLVGILKVFVQMRHGAYDDDELERQLQQRGLMMRFFGPLARSIDTSWKMYPLGVLFGVGFDTVSEIAFLVLAGSSITAGLPFWALLSLPILFAAGMSLLDTIDGSFMNFAYGWAFSKPIRKVYYNVAITGLSVAVAWFIGTLELCQVLADRLNLSGGFWDFANSFNLNTAGYWIVATFVAVWLAAVAIWKYGKVEARWENAAMRNRAARGERPSLAAAGLSSD